MKRVVIIIPLIISMLIACDDSRDVMASYKDGEITRRNIRDYLDITGKNYERNQAEQKSLARQLILNEILIKKVAEAKIKDRDDVQLYEKFVKASAARNAFFEQSKKVKNLKADIFKIRKLLIRVKTYNTIEDRDKKRTKQFTEKEIAVREERALEKITEVRNDIIAKKSTFENAVMNFSEDETAKKKKGLTQYFVANIDRRPAHIERAIRRMVKKQTAYRVTQKNIKSRKSNSTYSEVTTVLPKNIILSSAAPPENGWVRLYVRSYQTAYVQTKYLQKIENEGVVSLPMRTSSGWEIITIVNQKNLNQQEFADLLITTDLKESKNARVKSEGQAHRDFKMYLTFTQRVKELALYEKYGLSLSNLPKPVKGWQNKEYAYKSDKISLESKKLQDYINYGLLRRFTTEKDMKDYAKFELISFQQALQLEVFSLEFKNLKDKNFFNKQYKYIFQQYLQWFYKKDHWYSELLPTEDELKDEYKRVFATSEKKPSFAAHRFNLRQNIMRRRLDKATKTQENTLLQIYRFKLYDTRFKPNKV